MSHHRNPKQQGPFIHKGPQDFGGGSGGGPPPPNRQLVVSFLDPLTPKSFDPEARTHNTTLHEVLSSAHTESGKALMDAARIGLAAISGHLDSDRRLCNISIFNDIRNQVLEAQSLEQHIEEYKKKNKSAIIKSASFSHITQDDLNNLGIEAVRVLECSAFFTKISKLQILASQDQTFGQFWDTYGTDLERVIEDIEAVASMKPEASARLMIDQFMLRCVRYLKEDGQYPLLFPELRIANTKQPVTLSNPSNNRAIIVTGTVDYAMFVSSTGPHQLSDKVKEQLQKINDLRQLMEFEVEGQALGTRLKNKQMNLFLVEAKTRHDNESLQKYIPQAVTESLATLEVTETQRIAWCLTTGTATIFGVAWWSETGHALFARSKILELDTKPARPEDKGKFCWSARKMLSAIIVWCTSDAATLVNALQEQ